jgi:hypothetical protein
MMTETKEIFGEESYKRALPMKGELVYIDTEITISPSNYNIVPVPPGHPLLLAEVYPAPMIPEPHQRTICQGWVYKDFLYNYDCDYSHLYRVAESLLGPKWLLKGSLWLSPTIILLHPLGILFTMVNVDLQKINLSTTRRNE